MRVPRQLVVAVAAALLSSCADDPNALTGSRTRPGGASSTSGSAGSPDDPGASSGDTSSSSGGADASGSSGSSGDGGAGSSDAGGSAASTIYGLCFDKINAYRATKGLPPYQRWTQGETCADGEAMSDSQTQQAHGAFPSCGEFAQNECPDAFGPPEDGIPACLQLMWNEGPGGGHYDNMTSTQFTKVACGVFVTPSGSVWSVQNFR